MLNLTKEEIGNIVRAIEPDLLRYASRYDERKYPPSELKRLRAVFATPKAVRKPDVIAALVWKYGHTGKANYPGQHRTLAATVAKLWPGNAITRTEDPELAFRRWRLCLRPTSFITVCFLLHLVHPDTLPILDQHNYRCANFHLANVRSGLSSKATPSQFNDLLLVRDFSATVLSGWEHHSRVPIPTADILDRYLMMYGKALKTSGTTGRTV